MMQHTFSSPYMTEIPTVFLPYVMIQSYKCFGRGRMGLVLALILRISY